jgi:muramoyltetrapeptide carboxypeptidase
LASPKQLIKPPALPEKARIAVVAPASPAQTRSDSEQATAYFEALGHEVVFGPNYRKVHGYLAGTDAERAADLQWALSEPGIDMVHTLCGGYGAARLFPLIDWDALGDPRIVCGFSDITALHRRSPPALAGSASMGPTSCASHDAERSSPTRPRSGSTAPSPPSRWARCSRTPRTLTC